MQLRKYQQEISEVQVRIAHFVFSFFNPTASLSWEPFLFTSLLFFFILFYSTTHLLCRNVMNKKWQK